MGNTLGWYSEETRPVLDKTSAPLVVEASMNYLVDQGMVVAKDRNGFYVIVNKEEVDILYPAEVFTTYEEIKNNKGICMLVLTWAFENVDRKE